MIKGKTKSGFNFEIDEEVVNDYEFIEVLADVDENPLKSPKLFKMLLGDEQTNKLKEHIKAKNGKIPVKIMTEEIADILKNAKVKN